MRQHSLPSSSIEHRLDVLPGVDDLIVRVSHQADVAAPRVEVRGVRLDVFPALGQTVGVEHELERTGVRQAGALSSRLSHLVGREEDGTEGALDALCSGGVVPPRYELAPATPGAVVQDLEGEIIRESRGGVVAQETLAESLGLPPGDHPAPPNTGKHWSHHAPRPVIWGNIWHYLFFL